MKSSNLKSVALMTAAILLATVTAVSTLNAQNAAAQPSGQSPTGASNVNVVNTPNVNVANTAWTKDVDAPGRNAFQTGALDFSFGAQAAVFETLATVPANQRLVLEYVSGGCAYLLGNITLRSTLAGAPKGWEMLPVANNSFSAPIRFYAGPGETVGFLVDNTPGFQSGYCRMTATGYYINLP